MKKILFLFTGLALAGITYAQQNVTVVVTNRQTYSVVSVPVVTQVTNHVQQVVTNTTPVAFIKPLKWTGAGAALVAGQLLAITNADGTPVVPPGLFGATNTATITVNLLPPNATNASQTITATVAVH